MGNYIFIWQLPLILAMMLGWVVFGGYLLAKAEFKRAQQEADEAEKEGIVRRRPKRRVGHGIAVAFLAGFGGAVLGGAFYMLVGAMRVSEDSVTALAVAGAVGFVAFLIGAFLVIYAMHHVSMGEALKLSGPFFLVNLVLIAGIGAAIAIPAYGMGRAALARGNCTTNLRIVYDGVQQYNRLYTQSPQTLQQLVDTERVNPPHIESPTTDPPTRYIYAPAKIIEPGAPTEEILAIGPVSDDGRNVLFVNGDVRWLSPSELKPLLDRPENADIAQALKDRGK